MLSAAELEGLNGEARLHEDHAQVREALVRARLGMPVELEAQLRSRLASFIELVLASAEVIGNPPTRRVAHIAGDAALALTVTSPDCPGHMRMRAWILYELADRPMMASAIVGSFDGPAILNEFLARSGPFASMNVELGDEVSRNGAAPNAPLLTALGQQAWDLAEFELGVTDTPHSASASLTRRIAINYGLDLSATDVSSFTEATRRRADRATRTHVKQDLIADLAQGGFPPELWTGQAAALRGGLLDEGFDAWSLSAPTGTGKTFLSRVLILSTLRANAGKKVLYVVPSRALVRQVTTDLAAVLRPLGFEVVSVTPQLVALDDTESDSLVEADVLVLTPEKADLLLRLEASTTDDVALVVIDEAHHIESGARGVLLELYLWRLKQLAQADTRFVFMSAVAPNVSLLSKWMGSTPADVAVTDRATSMRVGVYRHRGEGKRRQGWIEYADGSELCVVEAGADTVQKRGIAQLAHVLGAAGPVLVVARGKGTAETLAKAFVDSLAADADCRLSDEQLESPTIKRLDARLEREMYDAVPLRELLRAGVAYHHAGLPPSVREAVEEAISERLVSYVFATTTLAEGVNFPFSSVVVQALAIRDPPSNTAASWRLVTPRSFWNIAGRAGRAGFDYEGQVILYGPTLSLDKVDASIDPYLDPNPASIPPVTSALADGLTRLKLSLEGNEEAGGWLDNVELGDGVPPETLGFINLVRTGIAHVRASGLDVTAEQFFAGTLAAQQLGQDGPLVEFAGRIVARQAAVVDRYLAGDESPGERLVAELGLSLDTLSRLKRYVEGLEEWQFMQVVNGIPGGHLRARSLSYFFAAVMSRMAEPKGEKMNGLYSDLVVEWSRGIPFSRFISKVQGGKLEDLVYVLYAKIQYMLPWALYALDRFFEQDAVRRRIVYDGQLQRIAYLVDAGVPDFGALRLTHAGFERVDATRLSRAHQRDPEAEATTDVVSWVAAQADTVIAAIVRGQDQRRLDYDLFYVLQSLRGQGQEM